MTAHFDKPWLDHNAERLAELRADVRRSEAKVAKAKRRRERKNEGKRDE